MMVSACYLYLLFNKIKNLLNFFLFLGLVKSLSGLNISSNPLEFPPAFIVEKGTQVICFRAMG